MKYQLQFYRDILMLSSAPGDRLTEFLNHFLIWLLAAKPSLRRVGQLGIHPKSGDTVKNGLFPAFTTLPSN